MKYSYILLLFSIHYLLISCSSHYQRPDSFSKRDLATHKPDLLDSNLIDEYFSVKIQNIEAYSSLNSDPLMYDTRKSSLSEYSITNTSKLNTILITPTKWSQEAIVDRMKKTAAAFLQCGVYISEINFYFVQNSIIQDIELDSYASDNDSKLGFFRKTAKFIKNNIGNKLNEPTIIYYASFGELIGDVAKAFPIGHLNSKIAIGNRKIYPNLYSDITFIPDSYLSQEYVTENEGFLVEIHELGHIYGLYTHSIDWPSPVMARTTGQKSHIFHEDDCKIIRKNTKKM